MNQEKLNSENWSEKLKTKAGSTVIYNNSYYISKNGINDSAPDVSVNFLYSGEVKKNESFSLKDASNLSNENIEAWREVLSVGDSDVDLQDVLDSGGTANSEDLKSKFVMDLTRRQFTSILSRDPNVLTSIEQSSTSINIDAVDNYGSSKIVMNGDSTDLYNESADGLVSISFNPESALKYNDDYSDKFSDRSLIDKGYLLNNTYTKEQDNAWRKEVEENTNSGIKGIAKPNDTITTTGFYRMLANTEGTYTNYLDVNNAPIVVTADDLNIHNGVQRNEVFIEVNNGISEKKVFAKVGADGANGTATIPKWVAGDYSPDAIVLKDLVQYIAPSGALSTDVPNLKSTVWNVVGDAFPQKSAIMEPTKNLFDKNAVINGFYINTTTGNLDADATSSVSDWIPVNLPIYYLSGRTVNIPNVRFKDSSGTVLPPMLNATTPSTNYSRNANTILYKPPTAVAMQFNTKFVGTGGYDAIQLEEGLVPTFYESFGFRNVLLQSVLPVEKKDIRVKRVGDLAYIAMPFSSTQEIVQKMNVFRNSSTDNLNNNVNFESEYLINRGSDITVSSVALKNSNDDIAPPNLNGSYIGGNHGWNQPQKITKTAHGKTFSDIGKIGTDTTGKQFTIMQIINANNFVLIGRNIAVDGFTYNFPTPIGDITFTSGVVSGYTFASMGNTFEFIKSADRRILINGKTELLSGEEKYADYVDIADIYDAIDLNSVVEILITNANYSSNPDFTNIGADKLLRVEIVYRFIGNNCLINQTFFNYKKINLSFLPFIQTLPFNSGNLYINKLLPISDGVKTWDFRKGETWTTPANIMQLSKATWESATNPPDRFVQFTSSYSFATGFVKDKGYQREVNNSTGWLHTTRKIYPYGVNVGATILNPYQSYSLQCFRNYQNKSIYPSGRISKVEWLDNGEYYLMLDWNASIFETINLPKEVIGKSIKIVEKTTNVTVLSSVASAQLSINVVVDVSNVYGYLVLKITQ